MPALHSFTFEFTVPAPLADVAAFHQDTRALRRLTPPPIVVQLHHVEPLAEGSCSDFTLWFGPLPVRWQAIHSGVDPLHGFTDTQRRGPMRSWRHTHRFAAVNDRMTQVREHLEYSYPAGWRGLVSRALFNRLALRLLFAYRRRATRAALRTRPGR